MTTATRFATHADSDNSDSMALLRQEMRQTLLELPYRAFLQGVLHLLQTQGYSSVRPAGRSLWKGHNRAGGWDADARVSVPSAPCAASCRPSNSAPYPCISAMSMSCVEPACGRGHSKGF